MNLRIAIAAGVWLAASVGGLALLGTYKGTAGDPGDAPARWPAETRLTLAAAEPTLVLLAHPRCVCTRATLSELSQLIADVAERIQVHVVFIRPEGVAEDWMETDLLERARSIPNATILEDEGGVEAERFGAETSGQIAIYSPAGDRLFQGGITGARGHLGQNAGRIAAVASVRSGEASPDSKVFGCALGSPEPEFPVETP